MKNFSTRLILIALLFVVGPTIHKIVMAKQQKDAIYIPISEADQSSLEEENEEYEGQVACSLPDYIKLYYKQISFTIRASLFPLSLADTSFSPPPI
tara:strand:- start:18568 stop:18855 length:288 start_codon:yes stop_codon:yes gene_type:complete